MVPGTTELPAYASKILHQRRHGIANGLFLIWGQFGLPGPQCGYEPFTEWSKREDPGDTSNLVLRHCSGHQHTGGGGGVCPICPAPLAPATRETLANMCWKTLLHARWT